MSERPTIAYLAGNDVLSDARVLKYAAAAEELGFDVVAIGVTRQGGGGETRVGGARVVVVGTATTLRDRLAAKWRQVRVVARWSFADADAVRAARGQVARWSTTAAGKRGWRRAVLAALAGAGRAWLRLRGRPGRRAPEVAESPEERAARVAALMADPRAHWSRALPVLHRDEAAIGPLLDELAPDVVHVHDVFLLGVGYRAVERARAAGRSPRLVYDAHEYVRGLSYLPARTVAAYATLERDHIRHADAVVTVSEPLAELLERDHDLPRRPTVVLNAPMVVPGEREVPTLRQVTGVAEPTPLLVYGGGVNAARGVDTAVRALAALPDAHLVVVTNRVNYVVRALLELAEDLGVADRVHLADYVAAHDVPRYFADASVGLSTLLHSPNHDVALTNKFCEYLQAGLPIVTSDTPAQARLVTELDLGAVYPAGDADALAEAVRAVLADRDRLRARISGDAELRHRFSWAAQVEVLRGLYTGLLDGPARVGDVEEVS